MLATGSRYRKFWKWFQVHEEEIFYFERDQETIFDTLAARLGKVHPDLTFEFSGVSEGRREFVVSAAGIKKAFPEVVALVREAPRVPRWKIVAFRQRKDHPDIRCGNKELNRDQIFFDYVKTNDKLDLTVFLPGMASASEEETVGLKTIGYLMLDAVVGEYDVETKIAGIEFVDTATFPDRRRIPLRELAGVVDSLPKTVQ